MTANQPESSPATRTTRRNFIRKAGTAAAAWTVGAGLAVRPAKARVLGANDRINFAMIGCGGEGNALLSMVKILKDRGENVEIVAVCDIYRPRLEKTAGKYNAKKYSNHKELLADPGIDIVGIATPDHIHGYQVIDAVKAGKDVYCEKPITHWRQFELTKRLFHEVSKSDRILQIGSQYMSDSAWSQARELIKEGLIGRPVHAEVSFFRVGDWGERGMPIDDPGARPGPDLDWGAFLGDSPKREFDVSRFFRWRMYWDYAGGPATDLYPHSLSQVLYMLDVKMPSLVVGTGGKLRYEEREVPDTCNMLVEYPEKISVSMVGTQANDFPGAHPRPPACSPIIRGWEGTLTFEKEEIVVTPVGRGTKQGERVKIRQPFDHVRHIKNLFDCCRTRDKPEYPVDLAYYTQTPIQMGILSLREGKVARFDAAAEQIIL
ncbi:MAG: Gfo/Idh/MocA family oxidoreductase [Planctomycetes bacterium]|nr:Gfo/Idh/MocA family oxidoreductase [Planctomycetota bacterium]